jgi:small multidrug resistance family-3 protein
MLSPFTALLLFLAAVLEAGGDALVRKGLHAGSPARLGWFIGGATLLFAYGCFVNSPPWDFGRLLGVYIAFFFLVAQAIGWISFGQVPTSGTLVGGGLIVAGGIVIFARG